MVKTSLSGGLPVELFIFFKDYLKKEGFKATLDFPIICLIDELLPEFPDAKVLLNVRDSPETWVKES